MPFPITSSFFSLLTAFDSQLWLSVSIHSLPQFSLDSTTTLPPLPVLLGPSVLHLLPSELSYSEPLSLWCSNLAVLHSILLANVLELCKQEVCPRLSWLSVWEQDHFSHSFPLRCFGVCTCYASTSLQHFNTGLAWLLPVELPTRAKWSQNFPRQQPLPSASEDGTYQGASSPLSHLGNTMGPEEAGWVGRVWSQWGGENARVGGERNAVSALEKGWSSGRHFPLQQYWLIFLKCSYLSP